MEPDSPIPTPTGHFFPTANLARERHGHYITQQGLRVLLTLRERAQWGADPSGYVAVEDAVALEVKAWLQGRGFEVEQYDTGRLHVKTPAPEVRRKQGLQYTPDQVQDYILKALDTELQQKMHGPCQECIFRWPYAPQPAVLDSLRDFLTQQGFGVSITPSTILITWSTHKVQAV